MNTAPIASIENVLIKAAKQWKKSAVNVPEAPEDRIKRWFPAHKRSLSTLHGYTLELMPGSIVYGKSKKQAYQNAVDAVLKDRELRDKAMFCGVVP